MKRGRSSLVPQRRISARLQRDAGRRRASRTHCSVQCSRTVLILGIHLRAGLEQTLDGLYLQLGIPRGAHDVAVRRVMKWVAVAMVHRRIRVRPEGKQLSNDLDAIAGRSQLQGRVANVQLVKDLLIVESGLANTFGDKRRIPSADPRRPRGCHQGWLEGVRPLLPCVWLASSSAPAVKRWRHRPAPLFQEHATNSTPSQESSLRCSGAHAQLGGPLSL